MVLKFKQKRASQFLDGGQAIWIHVASPPSPRPQPFGQSPNISRFVYRKTSLKEDIQKKRLSFGHHPKVALTSPPLHFGHCVVTFVLAHLGQP